MSGNLSGYDLIGDIHGHAEELKTILQKMDYRLSNHVWHHPERKAVFVGDFIDRGPAIRETLYIVKNMVEAGAAFSVMGNHEFNALAFQYHHPEGGHIRKHSIKNIMQHYETLKQFQGLDKEWSDYLAWFANLPLFLELDGLRVVHACWEDAHIACLKANPGTLGKETLLAAHQKGTETWRVYDETLKGKEIKLPDGHYFLDKDGNRRTESRTKWWMKTAGLELYDYLFHAPESLKGYSIGPEYASDGYGPAQPPVFFGHYWLNPDFPPQHGPVWQSPNACCLDYSVAKEGMLVAWRHYFDKKDLNEKFVTVEAVQ